MRISRENRPALALSIAALVIAIAGAGGPVVAQAFDALNADKVDGKHAVGAGATITHRKGKLVATSATTGLLPNNIIKKAPDADKVDGVSSLGLKFPATVPPGFTVRGGWGIDVDTDGSGDVGTQISFPARIPGPLAQHFMPLGAQPNAACPGTAAQPEAAPGNLCVYVSATFALGTIWGANTLNTEYGAVLFLSVTAAGDANAAGTWAATRATS